MTVPRRRNRHLVVLSAVALALVGSVVAASLFALRHGPEGQAMSIPGRHKGADAPLPKPPPRSAAAAVGGPPYVSSVSANGRYFLDQHGHPVLVKGDSPWALMTRLSPRQAELWFANRQRHGVNAAIISLLGASANGGPDDAGSTYDGLRPFVDGNVLRWQEPYWRRVSAYLRIAADHGITVMLFPIDGWTIGKAFVPDSIEQCHQYGIKVAERFKDLSNIVWMSGGDYFPATEDLAQGSDVDHCIDAMMRGIRETGDARPFSMEMGYLKSVTTDNPYWARRVDWNFAYTYFPTYRAVLDAYAHRPSIPVLLGESNYERENNQPDTAPTTDETLRRQVLWALTSGAAGDFYGSNDWQFHEGWEQRLSTTGLAQVSRLRALFSTLPWWRLQPDVHSRLVTRGRGTLLTTDRAMDVLDNNYVTAARTPDGRFAVIYVPTRRTISVDRRLVSTGVRASWVDPASGARRQVRMGRTFTTPGVNAGGDTDWLLLLAPRRR